MSTVKFQLFLLVNGWFEVCVIHECFGILFYHHLFFEFSGIFELVFRLKAYFLPRLHQQEVPIFLNVFFNFILIGAPLFLNSFYEFKLAKELKFVNLFKLSMYLFWIFMVYALSNFLWKEIKMFWSVTVRLDFLLNIMEHKGRKLFHHLVEDRKRLGIFILRLDIIFKALQRSRILQNAIVEFIPCIPLLWSKWRMSFFECKLRLMNINVNKWLSNLLRLFNHS